MRDLAAQITVLNSIAVGAKTNGTVNGTAIDLANRDFAMVLFHVGVWTDGTHTPTMEESDVVGSGYTTVAAADLIGAFTAVAANGSPATKQEVGYTGKKRYVRAVIVTSGATTGMLAGADIITSGARKQPQ